jgi:hypothetical protein
LRFLHIAIELPIVSANFHRGTPGRTLAIFAACLAGIVALSIHKWWERSDFEEVRFPTGLGDKLFYKPDNEDFSGTRLSVRLGEGSATNMFRHNVDPVSKKDQRMLKQTWLPESELWLYSDSRHSQEEQQSRWFLKTAPGKYIEFGKAPRKSTTQPASG